ncbi:MAG: DNA primase [Candidatus Spechtbacterales bacterium]
MLNDPVEEIKSRLDVKDVIQEYVKLEKNGSNYRALCPFHKEKTPSFMVSPSRQLWRCFGCSEGGDMFTFVEKMEGADFPEALRILAKKAGVEVKKQDPRIKSEKNKSIQICELAAKYFHGQLDSKNGQIIFQYLKDRGISQNSIDEFKIGYAPFNAKSLIQFLNERGYSFNELTAAGVAFWRQERNEYISRYAGRIIFPISNAEGSIVAFGARKLTEDISKKIGKEYREDSAKYINTPQTNIYDKSKILYGLDKAKIPIRQEKSCVIMEGYTDVIMAHQYGYKNAVSASGTALTENQLRLISRFTDNIFTAFDMDAAGDSATKRGLGLAQNMGFNVKVVSMKTGYDPADMIKENREHWSKAIKNAKPMTEFYFSRAFSSYDSSTPDGKREIGKMIVPVLKSISNSIEQADWVAKLAEMLKVPYEVVWEEIKKVIPEKQYGDAADALPAKKQLSRKERLSKNIFFYGLNNPAFMKKAKKELKIYLAGDPYLQIMNKLETTKDIQKGLEKLDATEKNMADNALFEGEVILADNELKEEDFNEFIREYKKTSLDEENIKYLGELESNKELSEEQKDDILQKIQENSMQKHTL